MNKDRVEIYRGKGLKRRGQWRWRYVSGGNSRKLATGGEGYANLDDLLISLATILGIKVGELLPLAAGGLPAVQVYRKGTYDRLKIQVLP